MYALASRAIGMKGLAQKGNTPHAKLSGKGLDVVLQVSLDVRKVLGDGYDCGKNSHKTCDEPVMHCLSVFVWARFTEQLAI